MWWWVLLLAALVVWINPVYCSLGVDNDVTLFLVLRESPHTSQGTVAWRMQSWPRNSWIQRCVFKFVLRLCY
jgi:hypothetical protein